MNPRALLGVVVACLFSCGCNKDLGAARTPLSDVLAAPSTALSKTLFSRLSPEATGIDFASAWAPSDRLSPRLMSSFAGSGVALGDVDDDGLVDIYLTHPHGGPALYRNLGAFKFEDITKQAGLLDEEFWCAGPTFADVDNDGDLDLYVSGQNTPNRMYINNGKGRFKDRAAEMGLAYDGNSLMGAFADIDLDGDLDMYLVTNRDLLDPNSELGKIASKPGARLVVDETIADYIGKVVVPGRGRHAGPKTIIAGERDQLYENRGDGTFVEMGKSAGISGHDLGQHCVWTDYDRDGDPDLYVTNDFAGPDRCWQNQFKETGKVSFIDAASVALPMIPWFGMGCDSADLNNDGLPDLIAGDMSASTHYKAKLAMGDMAANSWLLEHGEPRQAMRNALFINTGLGRFMETAFISGVESTDWSWAMLFGDYDCDGWQDLVVCNGMTRDFMNSDLGSNQDIAKWINREPLREKNFAFANRGGLRFENVSQDWGLDHAGVSYSAASADLDNDGDLDLVIGNFEDQPWVYSNNQNGHQRISLRLQGTQSNRRGLGSVVTVETVDTTQTRELQTVRGFLSCSDDTLLFGLGEAATAKVHVRWPSGAINELEVKAGSRVTVTEPKGAAAPTRKVRQKTLWSAPLEIADSVHLEIPYDDFARQPLLPNQLSALGPGIAIGDVDGDGDDDLYSGGASGQSARLFLNENGRLIRDKQTPLTANAITEELGVLLADLDLDGRTDLYIGAGGVEADVGSPVLEDKLFLNRGGLKPTELPELRQSSGPVVAADVDRDGDLDLFVGGRSVPGEYPNAAQSVLLMNTGTGLQATPLAGSEGMVTAAVWSDTDNDGWLDLHIATEWGGILRWKNHEGTLLPAPMDERRGWWSSLAAADVDGDGDMDLLAGNTGQNTKYHADSEHPARLYYRSFKPGTPKRIVESCLEDGTEVPIRGKSCSTRAMPFLGEAFPTFQVFAKASLPDIYGDTLDESPPYEATELRSGVLLNRGDGTFDFRPFPFAAQVSPIFGMVALDATGDGHTDVLCAQNFFGPQLETGRFSGGVGVLLVGRGDGEFDAMPTNESGILWPGDATALVLADMDGDRKPEAIVAHNDGPLLSSELSQPMVAVRLQGPPGNPTGIGARLVASTPNGERTAEIHAGSGYLSQSAPIAWFPADTTQIQVTWPGKDQLEASTTPDHPVLTHPGFKKVTPSKTGVADQRAYAAFQSKIGVQFEEEQNVDWARARYREALFHHPDDIEALFGLGRLAYKQGERRKALQFLDRAVELVPTHAPLLEWQHNIRAELK